jgi:hypothetical protein
MYQTENKAAVKSFAVCASEQPYYSGAENCRWAYRNYMTLITAALVLRI